MAKTSLDLNKEEDALLDALIEHEHCTKSHAIKLALVEYAERHLSGSVIEHKLVSEAPSDEPEPIPKITIKPRTFMTISERE